MIVGQARRTRCELLIMLKQRLIALDSASNVIFAQFMRRSHSKRSYDTIVIEDMVLHDGSQTRPGRRLGQVCEKVGA